METMHAPETARPSASIERRTRGLTVAVAVLTAMTLGLAGWLAYLLLSTDETAVSSDVAVVVEDYRDAWNDYDGEAFLGLVTPGYRFYETPGVPGDTAEETAATISTGLASINWAVEQIGPGQMIGDENTVYVSVVNRVTGTGGAIWGEGISVFTLVKQGDTWKVQQHVFGGG